jgi:hypothetical protein
VILISLIYVDGTGGSGSLEKPSRFLAVYLRLSHGQFNIRKTADAEYKEPPTSLKKAKKNARGIGASKKEEERAAKIRKRKKNAKIFSRKVRLNCCRRGPGASNSDQSITFCLVSKVTGCRPKIAHLKALCGKRVRGFGWVEYVRDHKGPF